VGAGARKIVWRIATIGQAPPAPSRKGRGSLGSLRCVVCPLPDRRGTGSAGVADTARSVVDKQVSASVSASAVLMWRHSLGRIAWGSVMPRLGRHQFADVLGEGGKHQLQGLGIAVLERGVENRTGLWAELGECLRGKGLVALVAKCGAAVCRGAMVTAGEQKTREPVRQAQRGRDSGVPRARNTHPGWRGGLRRGVVPAGLRHGRAPQGGGEVDAAANDAAHRAAETADEARTNPLAGLGRKAGSGERDGHWIGL